MQIETASVPFVHSIRPANRPDRATVAFHCARSDTNQQPQSQIQKGHVMRHSLMISASILAGCLLIGLLAGRSSTGQTAADVERVGRYQVTAAASMAASDGSGVSRNSFIIICDTANGQCWKRDADNPPWRSIGSPFDKPAKKAP